jgi:putative nucleotidyltransferase with HDIG domain
VTPAAYHAVDTTALTRSLACEIIRGYDGEPTLLAASLAHAHAHHIAGAVTDASLVQPLFAWLERTCGSIRLEPPVANMLRDAGGNTAPLLRFLPNSYETMTALQRGIVDILDRNGHAATQPAFDDELDSIIAAFLVRLDEADPLSAEHSRAVSLWCRRLAARLGLHDEACRFAARCGMLHDVGKAHTPPAILHAPRALTDGEWIVMRDHTVGGARMLAEFERLRPFEFAARSHHERLDGNGYPDRLEAEDIPQFVRIVTVADCFNAMIGRRPYRLPLSPAIALEQLVRHQGTQFDPGVVEAMIDIVERPTAT